MKRQRRKRSVKARVAADLLSAVKIVRSVVRMFADGTLDSPELPYGLRPQDVRIAPYFSRTVNHNIEGIRYSMRNVTDAVTELSGVDVTANNSGSARVRRTANLYIRAAMMICEAVEEGWLDERIVIDGISRRLPSYALNPLVKSLRATRKNTMHEAKAEAKAMIKAAVVP
jgi:hypothetical protein